MFRRDLGLAPKIVATRVLLPLAGEGVRAEAIRASAPAKTFSTSEANAPSGVPLGGAVTGLAAGSTFGVTVVDGAFSQTYTATVSADGTWNATIPSTDAAAILDGTATVSTRVSDSHGNMSALAAQHVVVTGVQPAASFGPITIGSTTSSGTMVTFAGMAADTAGGGVSSVNVYEGAIDRGHFIGTATLSAGAWNLSTTLTAGRYSNFMVVVTDARGATVTLGLPSRLSTGISGKPTPQLSSTKPARRRP